MTPCISSNTNGPDVRHPAANTMRKPLAQHPAPCQIVNKPAVVVVANLDHRVHRDLLAEMDDPVLQAVQEIQDHPEGMECCFLDRHQSRLAKSARPDRLDLRVRLVQKDCRDLKEKLAHPVVTAHPDCLDHPGHKDLKVHLDCPEIKDRLESLER